MQNFNYRLLTVFFLAIAALFVWLLVSDEPDTPDGIARAALTDVQQVIANDQVISITWRWFPTVYNLYLADREHLEAACWLRSAGFVNVEYRFFADVRLVDAAGNESWTRGLTVYLSPQTVQGINCNNQGEVNLQALADTYIVDPVLQ